jgi:uncharacterized membrane protein YeiH
LKDVPVMLQFWRDGPLAQWWRHLTPVIEAVTTYLAVLDILACAVFAVTGALVASRKEMDIVGFLWLGVVTGVGGGTVRDLLLGVPVFWVGNATPLVVCLAAAAAVYLTAHRVNSRYRLILWLDAVGLALVTVAGTAKGLDVGAGPVVAVVMGVITAVVGGIIRDLLGQEPSIILRREIYVTAAVLGAVVFVGLIGIGSDRIPAAAAGFLVTLIVRVLALRNGWMLPTYRSRSGREPNLASGPDAAEALRDSPTSFMQPSGDGAHPDHPSRNPQTQ